MFQRVIAAVSRFSPEVRVTLIVIGVVAEFTKPVEEHCPGESVSCFSSIEPGLPAPTEFGVLHPVEREQGALEAAEFPDRVRLARQMRADKVTWEPSPRQFFGRACHGRPSPAPRYRRRAGSAKAWRHLY